MKLSLKFATGFTIIERRNLTLNTIMLLYNIRKIEMYVRHSQP